MLKNSRQKRFISDDDKLLEEWDWEENIFSPNTVSYGSAKICYWVFSKCGHKWVTPAYSRGSNGCGCPNCAKIIRGVSKKKSSAKNNSLVKKYPDIAKEWHYEKNVGLKPQMVTAGSSKKVWWVCEKGHEWETFIYARKNGTGCPICYKESRK